MKYQLDDKVSSILNNAKKQAQSLGNMYVGSEHILLAFLEDTTTQLAQALALQDIYYQQVKEDVLILFGIEDNIENPIELTQVVEFLLEQCVKMAKGKNQDKIDSTMLSIALLKMKDSVAYELLQRYDISISKVLEQLLDKTIEDLDDFEELHHMAYGHNNQNLVGRETELELIMNILLRKEKANPLLIGEPGVGKTAIIEALAHRILNKKVPESLQNVQIYELDLNNLVAGTRYRGDFEEKLKILIHKLKKHPNVVVFIDEMHQMIGAGKSEGSIDVASVLKPYLARGSLRFIGATTLDEYERFIEKDKALQRRFQVVFIKEPTENVCATMIQSKLKEYEQFHNVSIDEKMIPTMLNLCRYYMPNKQFPDKAMDVLDLACVYVKKKQRKIVNQTILYAVMEQITQIPIGSCNRMQQVKKQLLSTGFIDKMNLQKLMQQLQWMQQEIVLQRPLAIWLLQASSWMQKKIFLQEFCRSYYNKESMIELDATLLQQQLPMCLQQLKQEPYILWYIKNLDKCEMQIQEFFADSFQKGSILYHQQKYDICHCIIILDVSVAKRQKSLLHFQNYNVGEDSFMDCLSDKLRKEIDEVFYLEELNHKQQYNWIKKQCMNWKQKPNKLLIENTIQQSSCLEDAMKKLRISTFKKASM